MAGGENQVELLQVRATSEEPVLDCGRDLQTEPVPDIGRRRCQPTHTLALLGRNEMVREST